MLRNNQMKDVIKVTTSLENRGILLKGTTRKVDSEKERFPSFPKPLMLIGLPLMKNVFTWSARSILITLGLTTAVSGTDAAIQKKIYRSETTGLIVLNEETENIMKIVKSFEELDLLIKNKR